MRLRRKTAEEVTDPYPIIPDVQMRRVRFLMLHGIAMDVETRLPIQVLAWHMRNTPTLTFTPTVPNTPAMIVRMADVQALTTDRETQESAA